MNRPLPSHRTFATLFDVIAQSGMTTAAAAFSGHLVGSDDISNDTVSDGGTPDLSPASMNLLEDDFNPGDDGSSESDLRLKTDVCKVGTTVYGLPLYRFRYKERDELYEGVMAQDVVDVFPSAVLKGADGFLRVNYRRLGIAMRQVA